MPNIPPKADRKWKNCVSPFLYRNRNAIERMLCRLKDFQRISTRYDRNAARPRQKPSSSSLRNWAARPARRPARSSATRMRVDWRMTPRAMCA